MFELLVVVPGDGRLHLAIFMDVSSKIEIGKALEQVLTTYGRPADLIVNCAGIALVSRVHRQDEIPSPLNHFFC